MLLENNNKIRKHFGSKTDEIISSFSLDQSLDEAYFRAGKYYVDCGRQKEAAAMLDIALAKNSKHDQARQLRTRINGT